MAKEKPKVYIERAENMTKDGAQAIINVCKEYSLSDKIVRKGLFVGDVKEFIDRCKKRFKNIGDSMAVMIMEEEAGEKLI